MSAAITESHGQGAPHGGPGGAPMVRVNIPILATALALLLVLGVGVWGILRFVEIERARDLRAWQSQLSIIADSRAGAVNRWFAESIAGELENLAANEAVQLYMTQLALHGAAGASRAADRAQAGYLRNLLVVTAARAGFAGPATGPDVRANVRHVGIAGIGLFDMKGRALAATPLMPPLDGALGTFFNRLEPGRTRLFDMHRGPGARPVIGYAVPVFRVQGDSLPSEQVGWVLGVKPVARGLYPLLAQPGEVHKSAENILVRRRGAVIEYLSPLADGTAPLTRSFAADTEGLAVASALAHPGGFVRGADYREREVLAVSRPLARLPWLLVAKIDRAEALGESDRRLQRLLIAALGALALGAALLFALWRHGASLRASEAAARYAEVARRFEAQGRLLQLVTDSQPAAITIADEEGCYRFANAEAARLAGLPASDVVGKSMAAVIGPAEARHRQALARRALESGREMSETFTTTAPGGGAQRVVQATHVPLPAEDGHPPAVLMVESDITEAVTERARRERILGQLVRTLVRVVDTRDPFSAHQSERTAELASAIAGEMGLEPALVRAAETTGSLMNLGKIDVPTELLTKTGGLSDAEMQRVRDSLQASANLVEGIEFDGPVVESLRELQERWDGSGGPKGLAGEDIALPARIVAVANAFVAMVSPRAYRSGISIDEALGGILAEVGRAFDRRVVAALVSFMDNRGGRSEWESRVSDPGA